MQQSARQKYVRCRGNDAYIGQIYKDGSHCDFLRLERDDFGIFQIRFLSGSDLAYSFLPECTELLEILKTGIVGLPINQISEILCEQYGYQKF